MSKANDRQILLTEDAIRTAYSEEYRLGSRYLEKLWMDALFSDLAEKAKEEPSAGVVSGTLQTAKSPVYLSGYEADLSGQPSLSKAFEELTDTISMDPNLLRLYIAISFSKASDEAERRGLPTEDSHTILRNNLVRLSKAKNQDEILAVVEKHQREMKRAMASVSSRRFSLLIQNAVDFIYHRRKEPLSASDVAAALNVNRSSLARRFKKETGSTLSEFILSVKIKEACSMMDSGLYTLPEISDTLGFGSYAYFSRRFKEHTGKTPSSYLSVTI